MSQPTRTDLLCLDIDLRMADLWADLDTFPEELNRMQTAAFMRAAFGRGYLEALRESEERRGELCRTHGYRIPGRAA